MHTTPALDADAFNAWLEDITQSLNQWTSYVMTDIHQHNELLNGLFDAAVVKRDHKLAALEEFDRKTAI